MPAQRTQLLEDQIIATIQAEIPTGVDVMPFPEIPSEYERVVDTPQVWVMLHSETGGEERSINNFVQHSTYVFQIAIKARTLRAELGIYNIYDQVCKAILGKTPQDGTGWLKHVKFQHNGIKDGVFDYSFFVECPGLLFVEHVDTDAIGPFGTGTGPLLTQVTVNED